MPAWSTGCRCSTSSSTRCSTICRARRRPRPAGRGRRARAPRPIADFYDARRQTIDADRAGTALQAAAARAAVSRRGRWKARLAAGALAQLTPFADPDAAAHRCRRARRDAISRRSAPRPRRNVFDAVAKHVHALQARRQARRDRGVERGLARAAEPCARRARARQPGHVADSPTCSQRPKPARARRARPRSRLRDRRPAVIGEQDILGDRLVRRRRASKRPEDFIAEAASLDAGDLVVHVDHGIGRYVGCRRSRPPARRTTAWSCTMRATPSSICRSRTSSCCRATARRTPASSSTSSAGSAGRRARRGSRSASARWRAN